MVEVQQVVDLAHQRRQAAGGVEIVHQPRAGRQQVQQHRRRTRNLVEVIQRQRHAQPPGDRQQVDHRVGRSADGHEHAQRILERRAGHDLRRPQVLAHQLDRAPPAGLGAGQPARVVGGNSCAARQHHAQRLGEHGHGRGGAHGVAGADAARVGRLERLPFGLVDLPGAVLIPVAPQVGARSDLHAPPAPGGLWAGADLNGRQVGAGRAHQLRRRGLIAAAQQHHAIDRVGAQRLLDLHRQQVAVQHRAGLHQLLAERERVELQRHAAGRDHAALDRLGDGAQAQVAVVQLAPGIGDADHRLAGEKLARPAQRSKHRPVLRAKLVASFEPFRAA